MSTMREAFEKWFSDDGEHPQSVQRDSFGNYMMMQANSAWDTWQEAWRVASDRMQERCAKLCDRGSILLVFPEDRTMEKRPHELAAAIRAIPKE